MPGPDAYRRCPVHRDDTLPTGLVIVGHVGWATNENAHGTGASLGGSGYAAALAASALLPGGTGLVAQAGPDLDLGALARPGLDLSGLAVLPGESARFYIARHGHGPRTFRSDLGVAATPRFDTFPDSYFRGEPRPSGHHAAGPADRLAHVPPRSRVPGDDLGGHLRAFRRARSRPPRGRPATSPT